MKIYKYDPVTFEFLQESDAKVDPKILGEYLIPSFATIKKNPKVTDNQVAIFDENQDKWIIKEDYRGVDCWYIEDIPEKLIYHADKAEITEIGTLPTNITLLNPEPLYFPFWKDGKWIESKDKALILLCDEVDEIVKERQQLSFEYNGNIFKADEKGIQNTVLRLDATSLPPSGEDMKNIKWKSEDKESDGVNNVYVFFTKEEFKDFSNTFYDISLSLWKVGDDIKNQLKEEYLKPEPISSETIVHRMMSIIDDYKS